MDIHSTLKQYFSFDVFRSPQEEIIQGILSQRDMMVIMPTGGGKSLCYQLPALMQDGVTLVFSPLISLMKDQVDTLKARGIPAAALNSSLGAQEQDAIHRELTEGKLKLIYIAPERIRNQYFMELLSKVKVSLIAIDEAHCLSQWGHDFRPEYMHIPRVFPMLGNPPVAAFTATATPEVKLDIQKSLQLRNPVEFISGFARANISFQVDQVDSELDKYGKIDKLVQQWKTGIVYCATRKSVENVFMNLQDRGYSVVSYHGGLDEKSRSFAQEQFMRKKFDVAVATNAFGMGIDRSDIRFVAHFEMPGSIEALYQEAGRAGRDGDESVYKLLFNYADKRVQEFFLEGSNPGKMLITQVYELLKDSSDEKNEVHLSIDEIRELLGKRVNPMAIGTAISALAKKRNIERFDVPGQRKRGTRILTPRVLGYSLDLSDKELEEKKRRDEKKLKAVIDFAYTSSCRQQWILRYFGEAGSSACVNCDSCKNRTVSTFRAGTDDEALIVKKLLSGIARMSDQLDDGSWVPSFGRNKIIQCLLGSRAQPILSFGLDKLSTYGILSDEKKKYLENLFRELEREGLIQTVEGEFPMVSLTSHGSRVMFGKGDYSLNWPARETAVLIGSRPNSFLVNASDNSQGLDEGLLKKMKDKRAQLARARGGAPSYTIFPNKVLERLATDKPTDVEIAKQIPGIGEVKARKFLPTFLKIVKEHLIFED